jgi:Tfp pilus assembly protein FimT
VFIFLALLAIMLVMVAANGKTLVLLKKELQLIERQQVQRLERSQTNAVPSNLRETKPAPASP